MPPDLQLDHAFVFVEPNAPEKAALDAAGLRESYRRAHPGQGTANVCYCFDNAYLELLWVADAAELASPAVAPTGLATRAAWRENGANPFGIALRGADLPFETWDYRPPFLPPGLTIPAAVDGADPRRPFLFRSPGDARPDAWTDGRAGARQRAAGLAEIVALHMDLPEAVEPGPALRALAERNALTLGQAMAHRMVLTLSRVDGTPPRRLSLPDFAWLD